MSNRKRRRIPLKIGERDRPIRVSMHFFHCYSHQFHHIHNKLVICICKFECSHSRADLSVNVFFYIPLELSVIILLIFFFKFLLFKSKCAQNYHTDNLFIIRNCFFLSNIFIHQIENFLNTYQVFIIIFIFTKTEHKSNVPYLFESSAFSIRKSIDHIFHLFF